MMSSSLFWLARIRLWVNLDFYTPEINFKINNKAKTMTIWQPPDRKAAKFTGISYYLYFNNE